MSNDPRRSRDPIGEKLLGDADLLVAVLACKSLPVRNSRDCGMPAAIAVFIDDGARIANLMISAISA